jgi:hypothetical protein
MSRTSIFLNLIAVIMLGEGYKFLKFSVCCICFIQRIIKKLIQFKENRTSVNTCPLVPTYQLGFCEDGNETSGFINVVKFMIVGVTLSFSISLLHAASLHVLVSQSSS